MRQLYAIRHPDEEAQVPYFKNQAEARLLENSAKFVLQAGKKERWIVGMSAVRDSKNKAETSGTVEIVWDAANPVSKWLIKMEPGNKATVPAGAEITIGFELGVPPPKKKGEAATGPEEISLKGKVILTGGFVPAGESPIREFPIEVTAVVTN
jgi:hypothetical protein